MTACRPRPSAVIPEAGVTARPPQNHVVLIHEARNQSQDIAVTETVGLQAHHELEQRDPQGQSFRWSRRHD